MEEQGVTISHGLICPARYQWRFEGKDLEDLAEDHRLFALPGPAVQAVKAEPEESRRANDSERQLIEPAFQLLLDVTQFKPEDILIQVLEGWLLVRAQHGVRMDEHGFVKRSFTRQYPLPKELKLKAGDLRALLCHDGVLVVETKETASKN